MRWSLQRVGGRVYARPISHGIRAYKL